MSILVISLVVIVLDQVSKWWVVENLASGKRIPVLGSFMEFSYLENRGVAFGMGQALAPFYPVLALAIVIGLLYFYQKELKGKSRLVDFSTAFIVGGAIGNVIDRLVHSFVVDFISLHFGNYSFPVFNVADCFVTLGVLFLLIYLFFFSEENKEKGGEDHDRTDRE
ncbi:signal peptidase II [Kallipyga massiliensis]|uniref:signal peptidase II n=1 Tax=Kallipyga massiliensis TaxID=1472764 RepID=UPI0026F1309D|nr:signal peptidase II [Kallipyga massiliensis]